MRMTSDRFWPSRGPSQTRTAITDQRTSLIGDRDGVDDDDDDDHHAPPSPPLLTALPATSQLGFWPNAAGLQRGSLPRVVDTPACAAPPRHTGYGV